MILEENDYFVISGKPEIDMVPEGMGLDGGFLISHPEFEGMIFQAKRTEGDHVLAKILEREADPNKADVVISLNYKNYNIDLVSSIYARLFMESRKPEALSMFFKPEEGGKEPLSLENDKPSLFPKEDIPEDEQEDEREEDNDEEIF